jgi:uncharacterized protein (DUF849 family)
MEHKVTITAAITGAIHTPTMSSHLPVTPEQIAQDAIEAANGGAAAVHIHARDPQTGRPSSDLSYFGRIISKIRDNSDVIICVSTGGGMGMTVEERLSAVPKFRPELASLNLGSMNFGMFPQIERYQDWVYDWEKPFLESSRDFIFRNTFADLDKILTIMRDSGTKPEFEAYDVGQIYNLEYLVNKGLVDAPVYVQFVTGILGGIASSIENLLFMKQTADRLFGPDGYIWSAIGAGRMQYPMCVTAALLGGNCRVGMEDNLYLSKGVLAKSNAQLVEKMVSILREFSIGTGSPAELRKSLGLRGA